MDPFYKTVSLFNIEVPSGNKYILSEKLLIFMQVLELMDLNCNKFRVFVLLNGFT